MAAFDLADDAGRPQHGIPCGIDRPQPRRRGIIRGLFQHGLHVGADARFDQMRHGVEVGARHRIHADREVVGAELCERSAQAHDRIVRLRQRAVAAGVSHFEAKSW
jgi:hypothetical protein